MAAACEVREGDRLSSCAICSKLIEPGQWQVHGRGGRRYHHACWSHGTAQPIEIPDEEA